MTQPLTVKSIRTAAGLSQAAFAAKYHIPKRTIENWESGANRCPEYTLRLLAMAEGLIPAP